MTYSEKLLKSANPLQRLAQKSRHEVAIASARKFNNCRVLDFGAGDGFFLAELSKHVSDSTGFHAFEPYQQKHPSVNFPMHRTWAEVENPIARHGKPHLITCFEVLEHFSKPKQEETLDLISSILAPTGTVIISVPIENSLPSIPKNLLRRKNWNWSASAPDGTWPDVYTLRNMVKSIFSMPIPEHRTGRDYLSHMGFYFQDLEPLLRSRFQLSMRFFSPFPVNTHHVNSQVFYQLQRNE